MKKTILSILAISTAFTLTFAVSENYAPANSPKEVVEEISNDEATMMAAYPFATRNNTPADPADVSSMPTNTPGARIYFSNTSCRSWYMTQTKPSGVPNSTYFTSGGSAEWSGLLIACPF